MNDRPTGFVTSNEIATLGALRACRDLPPTEFAKLAFVSRDGTKLFDYLQPPVSSLYYPLLETGRQLSGMLIDAVQGVYAKDLQRVEHAELILRN